MNITTGRPVTMAPSGMVACPHSLASQAGVDVLRAGGSAVDAALAATSTLSVIYPHMTGLGGDAFWLKLPEAVLNQGQRYVGFQISTAIRPLT